MRKLVAGAALLSIAAACAFAQDTGSEPAPTQGLTPGRKLPFLAHLATDRGIELPRPFGAGAVYYYISRDIKVTDVRVGLNSATPTSTGEFAQFATTSSVHNFNAKFDVWLLPFVNVYAIAGVVSNQSQTTIDVTLPAPRPGGEARRRRVTIPTSLEGSVGGVGTTLAGGYGHWFAALDINAAQADLGFDDRFKAIVTSLRTGWHGTAGRRPLRMWANATYWDTFATASGAIADPDGAGTLHFEVDQGPLHPWTYGAGLQYSARRWLDVAADFGTDFRGGFYVAIVPVIRF